jgi:alcohol dehydrogenase
MTEKAYSAVLTAPRHLAILEYDLPEIADDDGLIKIEMAGICHTDVERYNGAVVSAPYPLILGHEIVGRVDRIGKMAARRWGVAEGDRVIVEPRVRCGFCSACIMGNYKFCQNRIGYGTSMPADQLPHLWGSYGQYMYLAPGSILHRVSDAVSPRLATLIGVAISNGIQWAVVQGGVRLGDSVVVQGVGPIGLATVAVAKEAGAGPIIATGLTSDKVGFDLAIEFGADATVNVEEEDLVETVSRFTDGDLADVVIDVTGSGSAVRTSIEIVKKGGTVVNAGITGDTTLSPLLLDRVLYKEVRLQGVFTYDFRALRKSIKLVERNHYSFEKIITHEFPLIKAEEALQCAARENPEMIPIKVAIVPN